MYSLEILIFTSLCAAIPGLVIGYFVARKFAPSQDRQNQLENQLEELKQQQREYQHEVSEHFSETAQLVNQMTSSYKNVHSHLAKGAQLLAGGQANTALLSLSDETSLVSEQETAINPQQKASAFAPADQANEIETTHSKTLESSVSKTITDEPSIKGKPEMDIPTDERGSRTETGLKEP